MAAKKDRVFGPKPKTRRRNRPRPFNHRKKVTRRSAFFGQRKAKRGQG